MTDLLKRRRLIYHTYSGEIPDSKDYLTFTAASSGTVGWEWMSSSYPSTLEYSINNKSWKKADKTKTFSVKTGDIVKWRGQNERNGNENGGSQRGKFTGTATIDVSGNILSIVYTDFEEKSAVPWHSTFLGIFKGHTGIRNCNQMILPSAGSGYQNAFQQMFEGCTNLISAPSLINSTNFSAVRICAAMFRGCTSLIEAPYINVVGSIGSNTFYNTFEGCTSLTTASSVTFASTVSHAANSCSRMFYNCASLTTPPSLQSENLGVSCYSYMFYGCSALTTMPTLPATTLVDKCYEHMFENCTSLVHTSVLSAGTLQNECYDHMFSGCTSLTHSPEIRATTIVTNNGAMQFMFYSCSSLNTITIIGGTTYDVETSGWIYGVSTTGTFITAATSRWNVDSGHGTYAGIPIGWTREDYAEPA